MPLRPQFIEAKRELLRALAQNATDRGRRPAFEALY